MSEKDDFGGQIVISGIGGRFPEAENMEEFEKLLFEGTDMITDDGRRWTPGMFNVPRRCGKVKNLEKFDASFFGVHGKQAECMDPQLRLLLEVTYEAIVDGGMNPTKIRGSKTGVFVGAMGSDSAEMIIQTEPHKISGYEGLGNQASMLSNRLSFTFDLKGPSLTVDTACSSSLIALNAAVRAIRGGECDAAIVAGVNLLLNPLKSLQFFKLGMLSPGGKCKSFDETADGYVRSEACVAILIQKKSVAVRSYAQILHIRTNTDGMKQEGPTFPSGKMQQQLIEETYAEANVNPAQVVYVEAHGTGTQAGDPQELNSIANVFCKNRNLHTNGPLLVGSVKSNMGHSEGASGMCSIAKVLVAMRRGKIPPNLHFNNPNPKIHGLQDGRLQVVSKKETLFNGGLVGINSFGFGGANGHLILKPNYEQLNCHLNESTQSSTPLILSISGRTEESVEYALKKMIDQPQNKETVALVGKISEKNIVGHPFRGFGIKKFDDSSSPIIEISETGQIQRRRPLWFIFSGMGSQWPGMGRDLLSFKIFKESIQKCAAVLEPKNFDLVRLLEDGTAQDFQSVLNVFVLIAAVQIGLVDLLKSLKLTPDKIIGHSVGELASSYCDGSLSAEQTIAIAYARGQAIQDSNFPPGAMAALGMSWEEAKSRCPPKIFCACHNSRDSVTIAGPHKEVQNFVEQLTSENIFARMVDSCGQAFHSPYIAGAEPKFREYLNQIIPEGTSKRRSDKWISSSIPKDRWTTDLARWSSVDYHVNNLLSPVLFHEALTFESDPEAVVVEVAPHCLLQPILKRSLPSTCVTLGLMSRQSGQNNSAHFLKTVGQLYNLGFHPKTSSLYETVQFPVSSQAGHLSPLVKFDHEVSWPVPKMVQNTSGASSVHPNDGDTMVEISLENPAQEFYSGHKIDGRLIFPGTGYLVLVWQTFAKILGKDFENLAVSFENVKFLRATILNLKKGNPTKFYVKIDQSTGEFQVRESNAVAATGFIRTVDENELQNLGSIFIKNFEKSSKYLPLEKSEVYKELGVRGYHYENLFQGVQKADNEAGWTEVEWMDNWVSFLDTFLHIFLLSLPTTRSLWLPTGVQKFVIDPSKFLDSLDTQEDVLVRYCRGAQVATCPGIEVRGPELSLAPRRKNDGNPPALLEEYVFCPYFDLTINNQKSLEMCFQFCLHLFMENTVPAAGFKYKIAEIVNNNFEKSWSKLVQKIVMTQPAKDCTMTVFGNEEKGQNIENSSRIRHVVSAIDGKSFQIENDTQLLILHDELDLKMALSMTQKSFILYCCQCPNSPSIDELMGKVEKLNLILVAHKMYSEGQFYLLRKREEESVKKMEEICINLDDYPDFEWVEKVKGALKKIETVDQKIYLLSQSSESGILGFTNCLRCEPGWAERVRVIFDQSNSRSNKIEPKTANFDFDHPDTKLKTILQADLVMNVFQEGVWGSYRLVPMAPTVSKNISGAQTHFYLSPTVKGDLSSLRWIQKGPLTQNDQSCQVHFAPVNTRDVQLATGKLTQNDPWTKKDVEPQLGFEFSGVSIGTGQKLMGCGINCGLSTMVNPHPIFTWKIPDHWTLEQAATVPVAYSTAIYALLVRAKISKGESLLINSNVADSMFAQAAMRIALSLNCQIFCTAESDEHANFLYKEFPQVEQKYFVPRHNNNFEDHVKLLSEWRGVDVVLNFLAAQSDFEQAARCLAKDGRFLQISEVDNVFKNGGPWLKNSGGATFHTIQLESIFDTSATTADAGVLVKKILEEGIISGLVQPLPSTVFGVDEIEKAFEFVAATGQNFEKVLLKMADNTKNPEVILPVTYFSPKKSYIILGGLGGLGLELAHFLVTKGARKLVLVSRSGVTNGYQQFILRRLANLQVDILTLQTNAGTMDGANRLLMETMKKFDCPIGGIFNLAMVATLDLLDNQSGQTFKKAAEPKVDATKNLDVLTRQLVPEMDFFVTFSSFTSCRGTPGQTSYGYSNSVMDRICEERLKRGYPALAIQWGAIDEVGIAAEQLKKNKVRGLVFQKIQSVLDTLELFLQQSIANKKPILSSCVAENLLDDDAPENENSNNSSENSLVEHVVQILGLRNAGTKGLNEDTSFQDFGMDSIQIVEIKNLLERERNLSLPQDDIRKLTFKQLKEIQNIGQKAEAEAPKQEIGDPEPQTQLDGGFLNKEPHPKNDPPSSSEPPEFVEQVTKISKNHELPQEIEKESLKTANLTQKTHSDPGLAVRLRRKFFYVIGLINLILLCFLYVASLILKFGTKIYLKYRYHNNIKLMDRTSDPLFALDPSSSNIVINLKCQGQPQKKEILTMFQKKVFEMRTTLKLDGSTETLEPYSPYDLLKWRINDKNLFFYCWERHQNFDLGEHIIFEETTNDLDEELKTAAEFYFNHPLDPKNPQWQIRIILNPSVGQFAFIFACHHSYGDAMSLCHLIEYALADEAPPKLLSSLPQGDTVSVNFFKNISSTFGAIHDFILESIKMYEDAWGCPPPPPKVQEEDDHLERECQWAVFDLKKFRMVRSKRSKKSVPFNVIVLQCISKAYEKIYANSGIKLPKNNMIVAAPQAIGPYEKLGVVNNIIPAFNSFPILSQEGQDEDRLTELQNIVEEATRPKLLAMHHRMTALQSSLIKPLLSLVKLAPKHTLIFSTVPLRMRKNFALLGGHRVIMSQGYPPLWMGSQGSLGCGIHDGSVTLSLVMEKRAVDQCSDFMKQFFPYFRQELDRLVN